jgi:putative nucleotide binding protein
MRKDKKEVEAVLLDILLNGRPDGVRAAFKREPLVLAVGVEQFKLLELIPKHLDLAIGTVVYIGGGERKDIERVKRRISYEDLSHGAVSELPFVLTKIVHQRESEYVNFYNTSISITPKLHMLSLIPGIGKKLMWEIIEQRDKKPFASFADMSERIKQLPHPDKLIVNRVIQELQEHQTIKYCLFTSR